MNMFFLHLLIKKIIHFVLHAFWMSPVKRNRITLLKDISYTYGDSMKYINEYIVGIEAQVNNLKCFFSDRITTQAKITEECEFFSLNKKDCLIKALAKLEIRDSSLLHKLPNFKNFIF